MLLAQTLCRKCIAQYLYIVTIIFSAIYDLNFQPNKAHHVDFKEKSRNSPARVWSFVLALHSLSLGLLSNISENSIWFYLTPARPG